MKCKWHGQTNVTNNVYDTHTNLLKKILQKERATLIYYSTNLLTFKKKLYIQY